MQIIVDVNLSDFVAVERKWKERFFSWPWKPWERTKMIYEPKSYHVGDTLIISPRTAQYLRDSRISPNFENISSNTFTLHSHDKDVTMTKDSHDPN